MHSSRQDVDVKPYGGQYSKYNKIARVSDLLH